MEFYDDMPATRFFVDSAVVLSGARKQDEVTREWEFTERILYTSYLFEDKSISISIFDDITREYVWKPQYVKDYSTAERIIKEIAKEYPGKVKVKSLLSQWQVFYSAMEDAVFIESPVRDTDGSCGQCDDYNRDEFIFLYVPAVPGTKLDQPSLGLHWDFGCFGGEKWSGEYEEVVEEVTSLTSRMHSSAEDQYRSTIEEVQKTLETVR